MQQPFLIETVVSEDIGVIGEIGETGKTKLCHSLPSPLPSKTTGCQPIG